MVCEANLFASETGLTCHSRTFLQKYAAVSSVRIKWPRFWVLSVAWLRITFAGWETLFDFPDNGAVYWVGFMYVLV